MNVVGEVELSIAMKDCHIGFIIMRNSVWYIAKMVEKFHLTWHHIHIPLKEHGGYKDVFIVTVFIQVYYWC
jgi:hypothetical protein